MNRWCAAFAFAVLASCSAPTDPGSTGTKNVLVEALDLTVDGHSWSFTHRADDSASDHSVAGLRDAKTLAISAGWFDGASPASLTWSMADVVPLAIGTYPLDAAHAGAFGVQVNSQTQPLNYSSAPCTGTGTTMTPKEATIEIVSVSKFDEGTTQVKARLSGAVWNVSTCPATATTFSASVTFGLLRRDSDVDGMKP